MMLKRTRWYLHDLDVERTYRDNKAPVPEPDINKSNLIGSLLPNGLHGPCIDLDFPCRLYPSRTSGHFHLYLERELPWESYDKLLTAFYQTGLIQMGFYKAAINRQQTFLRPPGAASPSCMDAQALDSEIIELIRMVRVAIGSGPPKDELDQKITALGEHLYSMMAAKLDEIVARRVERGVAAALSSEKLPQRSDSDDDPPRRIDVHRVYPLRRKPGG
jgi:hypothetical protein